MNCKNCNRELRENASFCVFCGAKVENNEKTPAIAQNNGAVGDFDELSIYMPAEEPVPEKKKSRVWLVLLIVFGGISVLLLGALLIGAIACFIFGGSFGGFDGLFASKEGYEEEVSCDDSDFIFEDTTAPVFDSLETEPETVPATEDIPVYEDTAAEETTEAAENDPRRVVVANGGLRLRSTPDLSGAIAGLIPNGTIIEVEIFENNWAYTTVNGVSGWCSCDYLFVPFEYDKSPVSRATVSSAQGIQIISDQYEGADILRTLVPKGETLYIYMTEGDQAYVSYNNIYGWCPTDGLEITYEY